MRFIQQTTFLFTFLFSVFSCSQKKTHQFTNALIHESSPYLLQHAHNPVNWFPWDIKYLEKAKKENKLILLSIGYSSCHWCHVMEKETFEDQEVADFMNQHFINIKIDREEHPDVDKTYMNAVQIMTGSGGWPLNCIILPDGKPIWGGTYFPKGAWLDKLKQIHAFTLENPNQTQDFAARLTQDLQAINTVNSNTDAQLFKADTLKRFVDTWAQKFDHTNGGTMGRTQFPKPNSYQFLLRYAYQTDHQELLDFVMKTLDKMALGGLNDHLDGGFARYTVDNKWHVPHFEKMLYDNGQLMSLFSYAYQITKKERYKEVVYKTLAFLSKELYNDDLYYASLNADSENEVGEAEEGAYYTWKKEDLQRLLNVDFDLFSDYYSIGKTELVESKYVLVRNKNDIDFVKKHGLQLEAFHEKKNGWNTILIKEREKREKPSLDTKILTSWNALTLQGLIDAYKVFGDDTFKEKAINNAMQLKKNGINSENELLRSLGKDHKKIDAYLEDYALLIHAYIALYQITFDESWLQLSKQLMAYTQQNFFNSEQGYFNYTNSKKTHLIATNIELDDAVIPSSNSVMCKNLLYLGHYFGDENYLKLSKDMLHNLLPKIEKYPNAYGNWLDVYANYAFPFYETAICGKDAIQKAKEFHSSKYLPYSLTCGSTSSSELPLLKNRFDPTKTLLYVCVNKSCKLPTESVSIALGQVQPKTR